MKVRQGFVSNSSSSSFLVGLHKDSICKNLKKALSKDYDKLFYKDVDTKAYIKYCKKHKDDCIDILAGTGYTLLEGDSLRVFPLGDQRICDEMNDFYGLETPEEIITPENLINNMLSDYDLGKEEVKQFFKNNREISFVELCHDGDGGTEIEHQLYGCIDVDTSTKHIEFLRVGY